MSKWVWCDTHNHRYNEDDGCEYCYEIWKLISEFVKDIAYYTDTCDDSRCGDDEESDDHRYWMKKQKKWEEKL